MNIRDSLHTHQPGPLKKGKLKSRILNPSSTGKRLIVIQLSGGNDGLNTVVPYRNDHYFNARPTIAIEKKSTFDIDGDSGFHTNLKGLKTLFDQGLVTIINSVGYPNPNRSHFSSMDIWHTASLKVDRELTGWIGRLIDVSGQSGKINAIELNDILSLALKGVHQNGFSVNNLLEYFRSMREPNIQALIHGAVPSIRQNENLIHIYNQLKSGYYSIEPIVDRYKGLKPITGFTDSEFGSDCESVVKLILSGADAMVYYIPIGGFDTHVYQSKFHGLLMQNLGDNLNHLVQTLKSYDKMSETLILVFSEFGRRVYENSSKGTDHGAANNVFVIGHHLSSPGVYNPPPALDNLVDGDIPYQIDFRSIYSDILKNWLGVNPAMILDEKFPPLGLFGAFA